MRVNHAGPDGKDAAARRRLKKDGLTKS